MHLRPSPSRLLLAIFCLAVAIPCLAGCSGGGSGGAAAQPAGGGASGAAGGRSEASSGQSQAAHQAESERKLRAAQTRAARALCERLVDCAVESARANMSPEEVAKLDVQETAPRLREECEAEGAKTEWSPRQVLVTQRCVVEAGTCDDLQTCLDQAKKKSD